MRRVRPVELAIAAMPDVIRVDGLVLPVGGCHATRIDDLLWTSAIVGTNEGHASREPVAEMECALGELSRVLNAAGCGWQELLRVNVYYAASIDPPTLQACQQVLFRTIGVQACAGSSILLAPAATQARIALEAVAATSAGKRVLNAGVLDIGGWASAVRCGSTVFVSGIVPDDAVLCARADDSVGPDSPFFRRAYSAYRKLQRVVDAVREEWPDCRGLGDVARLRQYVSEPDIDLGDFRRSRADLVRPGEFVSTTVRAAKGDPDRPGSDPWIKVDAELALGPRLQISVPGVWANPGGLHAIASHQLVFFQAQMGRDATGANVGAGEANRHSDQIYANIDAMLAEARLEWRDVVHVRVFCRDETQVGPVVRGLQARTASQSCGVTCLLAAFFDPLALMEIEITAARKSLSGPNALVDARMTSAT